MATAITGTIRQEQPDSLLLLVHDENANEIISVTVDRVAGGGVLVEVWRDEDDLVESVLVERVVPVPES